MMEMILLEEASLKEEYNMKRIYSGFLFVLFLFSACTKEKSTSPIDPGLGYFPVSPGNYRIYKLDSLFYNDFTSVVDTFRFLVKEIIGEEFVDGAGEKRNRLERYYRKNASEEWRIADVWSVVLNNSYSSITEENIPLVKLSFPVSKGREWNVNAFNSREPSNGFYEFIDVPQTIDGVYFEKTLRVSTPSDSNLITTKFSFEEYAYGIGMIHKRYCSLEDRDSVIDFSRPLRARADYGFDVTYTLIEYGKK